MPHLGLALLIFVLRVADVSIGTLRVLYAVRGQRLMASMFGAVESGIFIFALSHLFRNLDNPLGMLGYALGFAGGTSLGITLEQWIGSGLVLVRIISRRSADVLTSLRAAGFAVTAFAGQGRDGAVMMLFIVAQRRRTGDLLRLAETADPDAFMSVDPVRRAVGGYLPPMTQAAAVRK
jgi:uncharacterized protein YebE (UPF0316 family)